MVAHRSKGVRRSLEFHGRWSFHGRMNLGDTREYDELVERIYRDAGCTTDDPRRPSYLARRILGPEAIVIIPGLPQLARTALRGKRTFILVRAGLPATIEEWLAGHELIHVYRPNATPGELEEAICDYGGAALQMPHAVYRQRAQEVERSWAQLAHDFEVTQTSAAMRFGEVENAAVAIVTPRRIYRRGYDADDKTLRELSINGGPGVRRVLLSDSRQRAALDVEKSA